MSQDFFWILTYGVGKAGAPLTLGPTSLRAAIFHENGCPGMSENRVFKSQRFCTQITNVEPLDEPGTHTGGPRGHLRVHGRHVGKKWLPSEFQLS